MLVSRIIPLGASFAVALALAAPAAATPLAPQMDGHEPNDTCAQAALIFIGTTDFLTLGPDDDYFVARVNANSEIVVDARDDMGVSLDVELFEVGVGGVGCAASLASATGAPLSYFDCGGDRRDLIVHVKANGANNLPYSIDFLSEPVIDDGLEDNDDCLSGSLIAITNFTTPGLVVTACDEDYFVARLQASGVEIQVDLLFAHADGDIDLELWDLGCVNLLASSTSTTDNESVRYRNTTNPGVPQAVVIRAFMSGGVGHNTYALTACFGNPSLPTVGVQVCEGQPNITGRPGTLCARGSDVALANNLRLYVVDLPTGSAGYFITSPTGGFTPNPAGSVGNLCLSAPGRYSFHVQFTGAGSAVFYRPWLPITPVAGGGFAPVLAGQRHFWQYWYRDTLNGNAVSNFSSALCVDFQ